MTPEGAESACDLLLFRPSMRSLSSFSSPPKAVKHSSIHERVTGRHHRSKSVGTRPCRLIRTRVVSLVWGREETPSSRESHWGAFAETPMLVSGTRSATVDHRPVRIRHRAGEWPIAATPENRAGRPGVRDAWRFGTGFVVSRGKLFERASIARPGRKRPGRNRPHPPSPRRGR